MAANSLLPLHSRACYNDSVSFHGKSFITFFFQFNALFCLFLLRLADLLSILEASLYSRVSQLLARQTLAWKHVCKFMKLPHELFSFNYVCNIFRMIYIEQCKRVSRHYRNSWRFSRPRFYVWFSQGIVLAHILVFIKLLWPETVFIINFQLDIDFPLTQR